VYFARIYFEKGHTFLWIKRLFAIIGKNLAKIMKFAKDFIPQKDFLLPLAKVFFS